MRAVAWVTALGVLCVVAVYVAVCGVAQEVDC